VVIGKRGRCARVQHKHSWQFESKHSKEGKELVETGKAKMNAAFWTLAAGSHMCPTCLIASTEPSACRAGWPIGSR
jgi:hypothetical protein